MEIVQMIDIRLKFTLSLMIYFVHYSQIEDTEFVFFLFGIVYQEYVFDIFWEREKSYYY